MPPVQGRYYDGHTSRAHTVEFDVVDGVALLRGDASRSCPTTELRVSEKMRHIARRITYPDGAYLETDDHAGIAQLLSQHGHVESWVARLQQSWRAAIVALLVTVSVIAGAYLYAVPAVSSALAKALPQKIERRLGQEALLVLDDSRWFSPSALPQERQQAIIASFQRLQPSTGGLPEYEILFRKSHFGPNAFALPAGKIVLTDDIVTLLDDEDAINAVLAHELGHLYERHLAQRIIQGSLVGAATAVLFGDISTSLAVVPTTLLDMRYSRDAERDADEFAARLLQANGIPPSKLAFVFEKLADGQAALPAYLSTHPPAAERITRFRH